MAVKGADDLAEIITECVESFRDAIRFGGQPLGPDGTIPRSLKQYIIDRAIWLFLTRGVAENPAIQSKSRRQAADRAETIMDKIMEGRLKVGADDPAATISHGVSAVRPGKKVQNWDKLGST